MEEKKQQKQLTLESLVSKLDAMGYDYVEGFKSSKKDKISAIHRDCGKLRTTRFELYKTKQCKTCIRQTSYKALSSDLKEKAIQLHSEGLTSTEIAKEIPEFTMSGIRQFLMRNNLTPNVKRVEKPVSTCVVCNNQYTPKYANRNTVCSPECSSKYISQRMTKYNNQDIQQIVELKKQKTTNKEIEQITGVKLSKIKEVVKENDLHLSNEDIQQNAYSAKLKKNPNCMQEMREKHMKMSTENYQKCVREVVEILEKKDNKYGIPYLCNKYLLNHNSFRNTLKSMGKSYTIKKQASSAEYEIIDFVNSYFKNIEIIHGDRHLITPKEIDIYIPSLKLGIEYCGLYWHHDQPPANKDKKYHYDKMKQCEANGIRLITIFENEWTNRQEQVKSFLKSVMGIHSKKVFARKCEIREVEKKIARQFLNSYHIQGATTFKIALGLYFEDELLGLTTGNEHHRQGHSDIFVLNRLVFKDEVQIPGGASKLLKSLINYAKDNNYKKLISWSDNRYSQGNVYKQVGFDLIEELNPDYSYVNMKKNTLESKQSNKKKLLLKKGALGTMDNTEYELAKTLELYRIWDCGKLRWEIKFN